MVDDRINLNKLKAVVDLSEPGLLENLGLFMDVNQVSEKDVEEHLRKMEEQGNVNTRLLNIRLKQILGNVNKALKYADKGRYDLVEKQFKLNQIGKHDNQLGKDIEDREAVIRRLSDGRDHLIKFMNAVDKARRRRPV